jgi:hypothetical protein
MIATRKRRIAAGVSAVVISALGFGLAGATAAGAAGTRSAAGSATGTHATPAAATVGTYELYVNSGSGFVDSGQLYLNSDASWSLQNYTNSGTWETVGPTLGMSDFGAGYTNGAAWAAQVFSSTQIGKPTKPGVLMAGGSGSDTFYAVYIGAARGPAAQSRHTLAISSVRPNQAQFPGTYTATVPAGTATTVYNSDNTWTMGPTFCDVGSYLSWKSKVGTKITYTVVMADEGCGYDILWMAKEHGATKLGTATKPGIIAEPGIGVFNTWYAVFAG